ncbi:MAG: hypothetical protein VX304_05785 [Planctomycetota bacterium]|nr:hypothetical protein [Planctomycetota bacterium]
MNPLSIFRHLVLLGLAYAALVAETSIMPALDIGGLAIRPLWIVLALVVGGCEGTAVVVWAAALGFTSDCLRSNGPLGLDLALATVAVCLLPTAWTNRPIRSITTVTLATLLLTTGIESVSKLVRIGAVDSVANWLSSTLPTVLANSLADAAANAAVVWISLLAIHALQKSLGRLLLPAPLSS